MCRVAREEAPRHLGIRIERVREPRHIRRGVEPGPSMVARRSPLVGLERLGHRPHRKNECRGEDLPDQAQRVVRCLTQQQGAPTDHSSLRGLSDARAEGPRCRLVVLEESKTMEPIRVESDFETPPQPMLHKLGVLRRHKPQMHSPPHVRHEGVVLDRHARQVARGAFAHDARPLEHLGELARDVAGLTPALRQAVHIRACAPIERHRVGAECHGLLT